MSSDRLLLLCVLWAGLGAGRAGMMGWLFPGDPPEPARAPPAADGEDGVRPVPFEVRSADEKFMAAVRKTSEVELSELDVCQHEVSPEQVLVSVRE